MLRASVFDHRIMSLPARGAWIEIEASIPGWDDLGGRSPRGDGGADKNLDTMIPDTLVRTDEVHQGADYRRTDII